MQAASSHTPLILRGGGVKGFYGRAPAPGGTVFSAREQSGIVDYDCAKFVITVRSDTPLVGAEVALVEHKQMLAFESSHFATNSRQTTISGVFSSGLSDPCRQLVGALCDFVLGAIVMDDRGDMPNFGDQAVRNVTGYDASCPMAGALSMFGLIVQVSLKMLSIPLCGAVLCFAMTQGEVIDTFNRWDDQPLLAAVPVWIGGALWVCLSGTDTAVRAAIIKFGGERVEGTEGAAPRRDLREQSHVFFVCAV